MSLVLVSPFFSEYISSPGNHRLSPTCYVLQIVLLLLPLIIKLTFFFFCFLRMHFKSWKSSTFIFPLCSTNCIVAVAFDYEVKMVYHGVYLQTFSIFMQSYFKINFIIMNRNSLANMYV